MPGELSLEDMINSVQTPLKKDLSAFIEKCGLAADAALRLAEVALDEGLGRRRERRQRGEGQGDEFLHGDAPGNVVGPDSA